MKTRPGGIWGAINQASYGQGYSGLTRWIPARIKWQKKLRTTSHQRNSAAHCIIETQTESDCTKKLQKRSGTLLSEHINFILGFFFSPQWKTEKFPKKGGDSPQLVPQLLHLRTMGIPHPKFTAESCSQKTIRCLLALFASHHCRLFAHRWCELEQFGCVWKWFTNHKNAMVMWVKWWLTIKLVGYPIFRHSCHTLPFFGCLNRQFVLIVFDCLFLS